jgi:hypothetical protein
MRSYVTILLLLAGAAQGQPVTWHDTLEGGLEEAGRIGRAVLLVTGWKSGV